MWQHSIEDAPLGRNSVICCTNAAGEPSSAIPQRYAGKSVLDIESPIQGLERRRSRWTDAALCISEVRRFGVEVVIVTGACAATGGLRCRYFRLDLSGRAHPRGSATRRLRRVRRRGAEWQVPACQRLPACQACRWGCVGTDARAHAPPGAHRLASGDSHRSHTACFVDCKR